METQDVGVLLLDNRRVFVAANDAAAQLLGVPTPDLIGSRTDDFVPLVARPLYPLAWQAFLVRGSAFGDYAAQLRDGSLRRLAYAGFANRPIRGLHFFVLEPLAGDLPQAALVPRPVQNYIQVGRELPEELRVRLLREADREEWRLPIAKGSQRALVAALFEMPESALDALDSLRMLEGIEASIASAAGSSSDVSLTVLAGRVPVGVIGDAVQRIRDRGGRVMSNIDERRA